MSSGMLRRDISCRFIIIIIIIIIIITHTSGVMRSAESDTYAARNADRRAVA